MESFSNNNNKVRCKLLDILIDNGVTTPELADVVCNYGEPPAYNWAEGVAVRPEVLRYLLLDSSDPMYIYSRAVRQLLREEERRTRTSNANINTTNNSNYNNNDNDNDNEGDVTQQDNNMNRHPSSNYSISHSSDNNNNNNDGLDDSDGESDIFTELPPLHCITCFTRYFTGSSSASLSEYCKRSQQLSTIVKDAAPAIALLMVRLHRLLNKALVEVLLRRRTDKLAERAATAANINTNININITAEEVEERSMVEGFSVPLPPDCVVRALHTCIVLGCKLCTDTKKKMTYFSQLLSVRLEDLCFWERCMLIDIFRYENLFMGPEHMKELLAPPSATTTNTTNTATTTTTATSTTTNEGVCVSSEPLLAKTHTQPVAAARAAVASHLSPSLSAAGVSVLVPRLRHDSASSFSESPRATTTTATTAAHATFATAQNVNLNTMFPASASCIGGQVAFSTPPLVPEIPLTPRYGEQDLSPLQGLAARRRGCGILSSDDVCSTVSAASSTLSVLRNNMRHHAEQQQQHNSSSSNTNNNNINNNSSRLLPMARRFPHSVSQASIMTPTSLSPPPTLGSCYHDPHDEGATFFSGQHSFADGYGSFEPSGNCTGASLLHQHNDSNNDSFAGEDKTEQTPPLCCPCRNSQSHPCSSQSSNDACSGTADTNSSSLNQEREQQQQQQQQQQQLVAVRYVFA